MISIAVRQSAPTASERVIPPVPEPLPEGGRRGCQRRHLVRRVSIPTKPELAVLHDPEMRSKACLAAAEALEAVRTFNERHAPIHLGVRFGLHTKRVFVGHAGAAGHFIYGIVGDIANTASRIEQLNKRLGTRLLSTEEVVAGIDDILVRPLGDYQFAGKRAAVSVVEVLCPVRDATMAQLSLSARFRLAVEAFREDIGDEAEFRFPRDSARLSGRRAGPILSRPAPSRRSRRHRPHERATHPIVAQPLGERIPPRPSTRRLARRLF